MRFITVASEEKSVIVGRRPTLTAGIDHCQNSISPQKHSTHEEPWSQLFFHFITKIIWDYFFFKKWDKTQNFIVKKKIMDGLEAMAPNWQNVIPNFCWCKCLRKKRNNGSWSCLRRDEWGLMVGEIGAAEDARPLLLQDCLQPLMETNGTVDTIKGLPGSRDLQSAGT